LIENYIFKQLVSCFSIDYSSFLGKNII